MIGYQNPNQGNARRKQLAQYLKGQGQQRAQSANRMRGMNTSALGRRSPGSGNPFFKGSSKASPEKFAFANQKPSLKTLLGLVGKNMGNGGFAGQFFSPDLPVGGLGWGGEVADEPYTPLSGGEISSPLEPYYDPTVPVGAPGGQTYGDAVEGNVENIWNFNSPGPTTSGGGVDPIFRYMQSYGGRSQFNPILGDLVYGLL